MFEVSIRVFSSFCELFIIIAFGSLFIRKRPFVFDVLLSSIVMFIMSNTMNMPLFKVLFLFMIFIYLIIFRKYKIIESLKLISFGMIFLIVGETMFAIILEYVFNKDISLINMNDRLVLLLPLRIVQVFIICLISDWRTQWEFYSGEKSKNTKKKLKRLNS